MKVCGLFAAGLVLLGCQSKAKLKADFNLLVSYDEHTVSAEPFPPPVVAIYRSATAELRFVGATHEPGEGPTHRTVAAVWEDFRPREVLLEGFPSTLGLNPPSLLSKARKDCANVASLRCNEVSFTMTLAARHRVPFFGAEPSEKEIYESLRKAGYQLDDLLGFYVVRQIPEWRREGTLSAKSFRALVDELIHFELKSLSVADDWTDAKFAAWYERRVGRKFRIEKITTDDTAPVDGLETTVLNALSLAINRVRNEHLSSEIATAINRSGRVLVVFGQGHLIQLRRLLAKMLDVPRDQKLF